MIDTSQLILPDDLRYGEDHEWARLEGDKVRVGISDYAQQQLGDITFVELPNVGDSFEKGQQFGAVESTKAVSDLFMPIGGEILEVNQAIRETPELVNQAPYGGGWMILVKPTRVDEFDELMTKDAYRDMVGRTE
ncbi:MAG: glycine cleavage system protein GcvH [Deltaproteobacteria bacterium]|nr:glycine cleavage system protein GcvH [Deltaproteobacteria bacterium]